MKTDIVNFVTHRSSWTAVLMRNAVAMSTLLLAAASDADAAEQGLTGKKLLLKSAPKLVLLSKDPSISIAGSDPVGGTDSSVSFDDGSGPVTFSLPKTLWSTNGSGTLFKYKNADAPGGPSAVKVVKVKPGLLKVVANGLPFPVPNGAATIDVVLSLDGGTNTYCMTFTGTGDGSKFLVKDAPAGSCSPPGPTATATATATATGTPTVTPPACTGELVGGFCWFYGGGSCDDVCTLKGLACDPATETYAGSGGSDANCQAVLNALGFSATFFSDSDCTILGGGLGCFWEFGAFFAQHRCVLPTTTCDAVSNGILNLVRVCACH